AWKSASRRTRKSPSAEQEQSRRAGGSRPGSCRPSGVLVVYSQVWVGDTWVIPLAAPPNPEAAMDFPITDLMDEQACYDQLVGWLPPDGLACPRCHHHDRLVVHRRGRDPVLDFRCGHCRRVFNAFTGTARHGLRRRPRELVLILRGFAQGVPTAQ